MMDTTPKYILMCEKAWDIQSLFDVSDYDNIITIKNKTYIVPYDVYWLENFGNGTSCEQWVSGYWESDHPTYYGSKAIWLPRQDQLQDMVKNKKEHIWGLQCVFHSWCGGTVPLQKFVNGLSFSSMEQLWLGFVMSELYKKRWDGNKKDWVKA